MSWHTVLHDCALALLAVLLDTQRHTGSFGECFVDASVPHGRALEITRCTYPSRHLEARVVADGRSLLPLFALGFALLLVALLAEIALEGNQDELDAGAVVGNLAHPLGLDVLEGVLAIDGITKYNQIGVVCKCVVSTTSILLWFRYKYRRRVIAIGRIPPVPQYPRAKARYVRCPRKYLNHY